MKLPEVRAAQPAEAVPATTDSLYAATGAGADRSFTLAEIVTFLRSQGITGAASETQNGDGVLFATASNQGGWLACGAGISGTLDLTGAPDLWFALIANNTGGNMAVTLPSGYALVDPTTNPISEIPPGVSMVYNLHPASPAFMVLHTQIGTDTLAHVGDADDTSLATLAASVDALRDALIASRLMAAS